MQPCKCPLCRRPINLLIPDDTSQQQQADPQVADIIRNLEVYNRRFGERQSDFIQVLSDIYIIKHIKLIFWLYDLVFSYVLAIK